MITSYAQRFEDVRLWRALRDVRDGFYIDVGAAWPKHESVTQLFYERGWRGVNLEPTESRYSALVRERLSDINIKAVLGNQNDVATFFSINGGNGLSTLVPGLANQYAERGDVVETITIPRYTLASVWRANVSGPVHFLKIDVEGAEREVLQGADFAIQRPWIILVEATLPGTGTPSHEEWEHILIGNAYKFAWFDGINRFYVADEFAGNLVQVLRGNISLEDGYSQWIP